MKADDEIYFFRRDFDSFRAWICLNLDAVTWQGRYEKEFEDFWELFFVEGPSFGDIIQRFEYAESFVKVGPISSWFHWLRGKFLCFVFIHRGLSIENIARRSGIDVASVATTLRNYFLEHFPHLDDELSEFFQIPNMASAHIHCDYQALKEKFELEDLSYGVHPEDVMPSMEVTLYKEWMSFLRQMRKDFYQTHISLQKIKRKANLRGQFKFVRDVIILVIFGGVIIFAVQAGNKWYKQYLVDKISIYEPQLQWLDRTLTFQPASPEVESSAFDLNPDEIEELIDESDFDSEMVGAEERFETESEITLTSWDSLPRDFSVVDLERSEFEELETGGYRDTRYGNRTVYRVMMTSVNTYQARETLNAMLQRYSVTQADKVRPGQFVPGGVYYNLFVPQEHLKEFLTEVVEVDDAVIYESRTRARGRAPAGHSKVFIWMKSL